LEWRLAVQVVAIDPSAAFRKALRMWLPRTAVAVDGSWWLVGSEFASLKTTGPVALLG
jgi:hypothetical protein